MGQTDDYRWHTGSITRTLESIPCPAEFERIDTPQGSFSAWLRGLPLKPQGSPVLLFDGREKRNQTAQYAVIDIDVGQRDLQQCADAVIRLHAEFLFDRGQPQSICYLFTSGDRCCFSEWSLGIRPQVDGNRVEWVQTDHRASDYASFRSYLNTVFTYAGTASLATQLPRKVTSDVRVGDVYIEPGFPGHAVLVVDLASDAAGQHVMLLAQSYMPAQSIHVLNQPGASHPWYPCHKSGPLITPEWRFDYRDRFRLQ